MTGLPQGWESISLEELGMARTPSIDPSLFPDERFELFSVPSYSNLAPEQPLGSEIGSTKQAVEPGDVMVCKIVPHINRVWVVPPRGQFRQIASSEWIVIRNAHTEPKFLRWLMSAPDFRNEFLKDLSGIGGSLTRARPQTVAKIEIPLPPLPEQRRMVRKLDTLSARSTTARTHLTAIEKLVERYKHAVLFQAFNGNLTARWRLSTPLNQDFDPFSEATNRKFQADLEAFHKDSVRWEKGEQSIVLPKRPRQSKPPAPISKAQKDAMWSLPRNWDWVQIGSMAFVTKLAGFEYTDYVRYDEDGDLNVLKAENAGKDGFRPTVFSKVVSSTVANLTRSQIFGGEILVVFVGAGVGNVAAVPEGQRYFLGPNIGMVRPHTNSLNSLYLEYFLRSVEGKQLLLSEAKAVAQPSISMGAIRNTPVPVCHPTEQREIVRRIESAFAKIDRLAAEASKGLKLLSHLDQRILAKAFRGGLVPQDPTDEPAETLLARIREARAARPRSKRSRQR